LVWEFDLASSDSYVDFYGQSPSTFDNITDRSVDRARSLLGSFASSSPAKAWNASSVSSSFHAPSDSLALWHSLSLRLKTIRACFANINSQANQILILQYGIGASCESILMLKARGIWQSSRIHGRHC
jgi:hypothetical protein